MSGIIRRLHSAAGKNKSVLLLGATGTGKDLLARFVHTASHRAGRFVPINCAAIPETLAETTLFGCVSGAFTGAEAREGLVPRADHGTLFLDELGELPQKVQAKLLRFLETGEVFPVWAGEARIVNVRVVAATSRDRTADGPSPAVRQDLLARLEDEVAVLPPLRERKEDVLPLLCYQILLAGKDPLELLTPDFVEVALIYDWPRNVRQLLKTIETCVSRNARRQKLSAVDLDDLLETAGGGPGRLGAAPAIPTAGELQRKYDEYGGNVTQLARHFRWHRTQVYRWMRQHGVGRFGD